MQSGRNNKVAKSHFKRRIVFLINKKKQYTCFSKVHGPELGNNYALILVQQFG